jgi:hypothetical protein
MVFILHYQLQDASGTVRGVQLTEPGSPITRRLTIPNESGNLPDAPGG